MNKRIILMLTLLSQFALADYFAPVHGLRIPPSTTTVDSGISEAMFNKVIDHVEAIYKPIIASMGKELVIERKWSDSTVNAYASRRGNTYHVAMFGGLARHPEATADGFAMVLCHEIGHHIGGAPRYGKNSQWASVEGQSDYWATAICAKKIYTGADNWETISKRYRAFKSMDPRNRRDSTLHNEYAMQKCSETYADADKIAICLRTSLGGLSLARLLGSLRSSQLPTFESPSTEVVKTTYEAHPKAQCRLDTYFQGALCPADMDDVIDQNDANLGACTRRDGFQTGSRPLCWYQPKAQTDNDSSDPTRRSPFTGSRKVNNKRYY